MALLAGAVMGPVATAQTVSTGNISDGSLVWGVSGYAQDGIFGPWTFGDTEGNATILEGSVGSGTQTEYVPAAFPATSYPASLADAGKTPNAVKFTEGRGTRNSDGQVTIRWDGEFTINAYGGSLGAPDETFSDPILTMQPDGSTEVSFDVHIGEGRDSGGAPSPAVDAGRLTLLTIDASGYSRYRGTIQLNPNYAGVEYHTGQNRSCTAPDVWGAWPAAYIDALPSSVRGHYYSTACGGKQNLKRALPAHVKYTLIEGPIDGPVAAEPAITVSETTLSAEGEHQVTVTGTGFNNPGVVATYGNLKDKNAGVLVSFGRFFDEWQPSLGTTGVISRQFSDQVWALPQESFDIVGANTADVVIDADGNFTATLTVSKAAADALSTQGNYGIYTYPGRGVKEASYELFTPITFAETDGQPGDGEPGDGEPGDGDIDDPTTPGNGVSGSLGSLMSFLR